MSTQMHDEVLIESWKSLSVYDLSASDLKQKYTSKRNMVVLFTLITSIASVLLSMFGDAINIVHLLIIAIVIWSFPVVDSVLTKSKKFAFFPFLKNFLFANLVLLFFAFIWSWDVLPRNSLSVVLFLISVLLPYIGAKIMELTRLFNGTTDWIRYRNRAEQMRMEIYLYRTKAGEYAKVQAHQRDNLLAKNISSVKDSAGDKVEGLALGAMIPPSYPEPATDEETFTAIAVANSNTNSDDGLKDLSIDEYIKHRVKTQQKWYEQRLKLDLQTLSRYHTTSSSFLVLGAFISFLLGGVLNLGLQWVGLVAICNAFAVAISSWSSVNMYGMTFSLFNITAQRLSDASREWKARRNDPDMNDKTIASQAQCQFVETVEKILQDERDQWFRLAIQFQANSDQTILQTLDKQLNRGDNTDNPDKNNTMGNAGASGGASGT